MAVFWAGRPFWGVRNFFSKGIRYRLRGSNRGQTPWPSGGARKPSLLEKRTEVLRGFGGDGLAGEVSERSVEGFREVELPRVQKL